VTYYVRKTTGLQLCLCQLFFQCNQRQINPSGFTSRPHVKASQQGLRHCVSWRLKRRRINCQSPFQLKFVIAPFQHFLMANLQPDQITVERPQLHCSVALLDDINRLRSQGISHYVPRSLKLCPVFPSLQRTIFARDLRPKSSFVAIRMPAQALRLSQVPRAPKERKQDSRASGTCCTHSVSSWHW
jgi:hypothetical protein